MSQSHIRKSDQPAHQPIAWWKLALAFAVVIMSFLAVYLAANWIHSFPSAYETVSANILEIRKVVDHTNDSQYGGRIFYRVEAHVHYAAKGQMQDRWLRVSDVTPEAIVLRLAGHPTQCLVYWPPDHPENAKCSFK